MLQESTSFDVGDKQCPYTNVNGIADIENLSSGLSEEPRPPVLSLNAPTKPDEHLASCGPLTEQLIMLQRLRMMQINRHQLINLPMQAAIRTFCGFNPFAEAKVAKAAKERAQRIWSYLTTGKGKLIGSDYDIAEGVEMDVLQALGWMKEIEKRRTALEKQMSELAAQLPAADWVKATPGFSLKGLAIITAEARADIDQFHTISKLWKRLGWANDGKLAQMDCSKKRKAEVYACVTECVFKAQSARYAKDGEGEKTDEVVKPAGPYRLFYDNAKAALIEKNEAGRYAERAAYELKKNAGATEAQKKVWLAGKLTPSHLHARALRELTCTILLDLWRVSKGLEPQVG